MLKHLEKSAVKNFPQILTGLGIAGLIGGTVTAVSVTPKVIKKFERKKRNDELDKLTVMETIKVAAPSYIPTLIIDAASITAILMSGKISAKRYAALAAMYQLSESALTNYKKKVIETIGRQK